MKNYLQVVKLMFTVDKKLLSKCIFVILLLLGLESALPFYMEWMIDRTEVQKSVPYFVGYVAIFVVAYFAICMLGALRTELYDRVGRHILWKTREKIYQVLWGSNYSSFVRDNKEKLKFILTTETYKIYAVSTVYTVGIVIDLFTGVVFLVFSFFIDPVVAAVLLLSILVTTLLSLYSKKAMLLDFEQVDKEHETNSIVNYETVDMTEITRTNGLMSYYIKRNEESLDQFTGVSMKANRREIFWLGLDQALNYIVYVMVAGVLILTGSTGGQLVTALFIANCVLQQSQSIQRQVQVLIQNLPSFNNVMETVGTPIQNGGISVNKINSIVFNSVSLKYENGRDVFNNLSFCLETGDHVLIEGENGSGKSSILKMMVGLLSPTEGTIEINGKNLDDYDHRELYKEICYISQDELFLNEKVEDYLRIIAHTDITDDYISNLREKMHLSPEIDNITDNGIHLSGGEKKKLLLIKCMLRSTASVMIWDEIDAGLDNETKLLLRDIEEDILNDPTKIVIKISHIDTNRNGFNKVIQMKNNE